MPCAVRLVCTYECSHWESLLCPIAQFPNVLLFLSIWVSAPPIVLIASLKSIDSLSDVGACA